MRFQNTKTYVSILIIFAVLFAVFPTITYAAESDCKQLYGGGTTNDTFCNGKRVAGPTGSKNTPTPTKPKATPTPVKGGTTTKGGLPVLSPSPQKSTPSTGPEVLGIIALLPAAAAGMYLRKRSH